MTVTCTEYAWGVNESALESVLCTGDLPPVDERKDTRMQLAKALTGTHQTSMRRASLAASCKMKLEGVETRGQIHPSTAWYGWTRPMVLTIDRPSLPRGDAMANHCEQLNRGFP